MAGTDSYNDSIMEGMDEEEKYNYEKMKRFEMREAKKEIVQLPRE